MMSTQKLPFEITPQIKRYLEEISNFNNEFFAHDSGKVFTQEFYLANEKPTHRLEESNQNFWKYLQENKAIKLVGKPTLKTVYYSDLDEGMVVPFQYRFKVLDIKPIEELLKRIKSDEEEIQKIDEVILAENYRPSKVEFDGQSAVLRYKTLSHKFQKGIRGDPPKLKLFKQLWDNRSHIRKGKKIAVGSTLDHVVLAVDLGFAQERHSYELNKELRNKFDQLVKDVKRPLKKKGFPLEIERKNGIQLVIVEK